MIVKTKRKLPLIYVKDGKEFYNKIYRNDDGKQNKNFTGV
jgi:hypothetical protein